MTKTRASFICPVIRREIDCVTLRSGTGTRAQVHFRQRHPRSKVAPSLCCKCFFACTQTRSRAAACGKRTYQGRKTEECSVQLLKNMVAANTAAQKEVKLPYKTDVRDVPHALQNHTMPNASQHPDLTSTQAGQQLENRFELHTAF